METRLLSRWELATTDIPRTTMNPSISIPQLYSIDIESFNENVVVVEEEPGLQETWTGKKYVWLVRDRDTEWGGLYLPFQQQN